jgi:hypothetical protein
MGAPLNSIAKIAKIARIAKSLGTRAHSSRIDPDIHRFEGC